LDIRHEDLQRREAEREGKSALTKQGQIQRTKDKRTGRERTKRSEVKAVEAEMSVLSRKRAETQEERKGKKRAKG